MTHYTEEELAWYAFDPGRVDDRAAIESHLSSCDACRETVEFIQTLDTALHDETPWDAATQLDGGSPPLPDDLRTLAAEIEHEQRNAKNTLTPLLESAERFRAARVENDPAMQTAGGVRVLADAAEHLRLKDPHFALLVADTAIAVGTRLRDQRSLRSTSWLGDAWKERAIALATIGRFRDAESSADEAEAAYEGDPRATLHDVAIVQLIRANIYVESERLDEAAQLAAAAAARFRSFGDTDRYLNARMLQGSVLYMRRDFHAAVAVLEEILPAARESGSAIVVARALSNAGECRAALGDFDRAREYFAESRAAWEELGYSHERVRAQWSIANILLNTGEIDDAATLLTQVHRDFEALGIVNDGALARLQLAEALLASDRAGEVPAILDGLVVNFSAEGLTRNANMALAYLREAATANTLDAGIVRDVRVYLEQLPFSPDRVFSRI